MADYLIQESTLDAIADAINAKTGGSSAMTPAQMVTAIGNISGGATLNKYTYTQASDAIAESNTFETFARTYFPDKTNKIYFTVVNNTSTDSLAGLSGVWDQIVTLVTVGRRRSNTGALATNTFKVGAGSAITVYELDRGAFV